MKPRISVVIPTHKRPESLSVALDAILNQTYPKKKYEVIVVSDTQDDTLHIVEKKFRKKGVRFYRIENKCCDAKRNFGIKKAKGEIIAFTDDDCIPDSDWLENLGAAFRKNKDAAGVEGLIYSNYKHLYEQAPENLTGKKYISANYAFKRSVLIETKGFDERYCYFAEDTDLGFKVISAGYNIVFDPKVRVFHPAKKISPLQIIKNLHMVRNNLLLHKKFPKLFKEHFGYRLIRDFILGLFAWLLLFFYAMAILVPIFILLAIPFTLIGVFYVITKARQREYKITELLAYCFFLYVRYLMLVPTSAYYWLKISSEVTYKGDSNADSFFASK
ncbi:MAG: glycosyltransferase family A protein [Candidatus Diapherotrites archaeon]